MKLLLQNIAEVGAQDYKSALSDVDNIHHPENKRQPGCHQCIDSSGQYPSDDCFKNDSHYRPRREGV